MPAEVVDSQRQPRFRQKTDPDFGITASWGDTRLTHNGEALPNADSGVEAAFPKVVGKLAGENRNYAAAEVRQPRQHPVLSRGGFGSHCQAQNRQRRLILTHLLNAESKYVVHVGRQQGQQGVEGPVEAKVGHNYGPERSGRHNSPPGDVVRGDRQLKAAMQKRKRSKAVGKLNVSFVAEVR